MYRSTKEYVYFLLPLRKWLEILNNEVSSQRICIGKQQQQQQQQQQHNNNNNNNNNH